LLQATGTLAEAGAALIDAANAAGGADNISVALVGINDLLA
jgi:serine/threonine protein phosphatase PrpC